MCVGMNIIKYYDSDEINKPLTGTSQVYLIENKPKQETHGPLTKERLIKKYPDVFNEGVGKIAGEHHIRIDPAVDPVQHAPHRVPVTITAKVKKMLLRSLKNRTLSHP